MVDCDDVSSADATSATTIHPQPNPFINLSYKQKISLDSLRFILIAVVCFPSISSTVLSLSIDSPHRLWKMSVFQLFGRGRLCNRINPRPPSVPQSARGKECSSTLHPPLTPNNVGNDKNGKKKYDDHSRIGASTTRTFIETPWGFVIDIVKRRTHQDIN